MPRSGSGSYTLPSGNPVVTGTTIESTWANTTLSDIATTLTDSLSRSGQGGMTAALRIADGTQGAPGLGFANETGSGLYRAGTGEVWAVVQGAQTMNLDANGVTVPSDKATSIEGTFVFNETGADKDARFEGDTDANLLFVDASADAVGIGTSSPASRLDVAGAFGTSTTAATITNTTGFSASNIARIDFKLNNSFAGLERTAAIWSVNPNAGGNNGGALVFGVSANGTATTPSEVARFDQAGNLGLGVTPSAWVAGSRALQLGSSGYTALYQGSGGESNFTNNVYLSAVGTWTAIASLGASRYQLDFGAHKWWVASSGTAGNAITFTQAMTLDASGNLGVGVTSISGFRLDVLSTSTDGAIRARSSNSNEVLRVESTGTATSSIRFINTSVNNTYISADGTALTFLTAATERARITSDGDLLVGDTNGGLQNSYSTNFTQASGYWTVNHANGSPDTRRYFYFGYNGTEIGSITQNGTTGVLFNQTSDRRLKDNIVPAPSASDVIDAIQIVSHDWKSAPDEHVTYGVIAQDLALVAPQAVAVGDDGDAVEKPWGVDYSKLVPMLIKEIQSLRARVAALEAQ